MHFPETLVYLPLILSIENRFLVDLNRWRLFSHFLHLRSLDNQYNVIYDNYLLRSQNPSLKSSDAKLSKVIAINGPSILRVSS